MQRSFAAFTFFALLFTTVNAPAQAASDAAAPATKVFHVKSRLVLLDVVVTDRNGKPVNDLKRQDFAVYEDKQPQRISSFEVPAQHALPPARQTAAKFNPDDVQAFGQSPVTVIVLDELNTHFADTDFAKRSIRQFLEKRPATLNEPTMLLSVGNSKFNMLQNFTRSRADLLNALNNHKPSYSWKLEIGMSTGPQASERLDLSINALEQIAEYTARIPGRKNLIWVGQGFPSLDTDALATQDVKALTDMMRHITDTLLDARVTMFAVDPSSNAVGNTDIVDENQAEFAQFVGDSAGAGHLMDPFNSQLDFDRLGPVTGGRVLRGMNDVDHQIAASIELGTQFYSIGYTPGNPSEESTAFRHIVVKCLRPGTTVMTRDGYYPGAQARQGSTDNISYDLNNAVMAELLFTALRIRVEPKGGDLYTIYVAAPGMTWEQADGAVAGGHVAHAEVLAASFSAKDKLLAHTLQTMTATATAEANVHSPSLPADFTISLARPKGTVRMRFIVRDVASGSMGSFDLRLP